MENDALSRFREAHKQNYPAALSEIRAGKKRSHWMWYIFPQMRGLGVTFTANYYALGSLEEAELFLRDPYLGGHLREISAALLALDTRDALAVFGCPDNLKLRSCMTLFAHVKDADSVFRDVLNAYYDGQEDEKTLALLGLSHTDPA